LSVLAYNLGKPVAAAGVAEVNRELVADQCACGWFIPMTLAELRSRLNQSVFNECSNSSPNARFVCE
jgi:hypothetical protein